MQSLYAVQWKRWPSVCRSPPTPAPPPPYFSVSRSPFRQLLGFHLVPRLDLSKGKRLQQLSRRRDSLPQCEHHPETTSSDIHTHARTYPMCMSVSDS